MSAPGKTPQPAQSPGRVPASHRGSSCSPLFDVLPFGFALNSEGHLVADAQDLTLVTCMHLLLSQTGGEGGLETLLRRLAPGDERLDVERVDRILTDPAYIDGEVTVAFAGVPDVKQRVSLPVSVPEGLWWENQGILIKLAERRAPCVGYGASTRLQGPRVLPSPTARALNRGETDLQTVLLGAHAWARP